MLTGGYTRIYFGKFMLNVQPWKPNPLKGLYGIQGYSALTYKEHKNIENSQIQGYTGRVYKDILYFLAVWYTRIYKDTYKYGIQGYTVVTGMVYKDITGMVFKDIQEYICIHR